jgi:hypothetical protein
MSQVGVEGEVTMNVKNRFLSVCLIVSLAVAGCFSVIGWVQRAAQGQSVPQEPIVGAPETAQPLKSITLHLYGSPVTAKGLKALGGLPVTELSLGVSNTFRGYHYSNLEGTTGVTGMTQSR